jgi:hypothetical protein
LVSAGSVAFGDPVVSSSAGPGLLRSSDVTVSDDDDDPPGWSPGLWESRLEGSVDVDDGLVDVDDGLVEVDPTFDGVDDASFASDEVEVDGFDPDVSSACATPGTVAMAAPTPSATASAPTRPMCFA